MKRKTVAPALCLISALIVMSCSRYDEKGAEKCLKEHLKCPATMSVVSTRVDEVEEREEKDTLYHIKEIYGEKYRYINAYAYTDSVEIDSIEICSKRIRKTTVYHIIFDAENLMGAKVRDSAMIIETDDGFMTSGDYYRKKKDRQCDKTERKAERIMRYGNNHLARKGEWQVIYE